MEEQVVAHFDKNMYHNYMIINDIHEGCDKYQEEMLSNNQVDGLLPLEIRNINDEKMYYYNITGLHDIRTIFEKKSLDKINLESMVRQIINHIKSIHNYLLEENDIVLIPEQIFIHNRTNEIKLCYCPGYNKGIMNQIGLLFEYLMNKIEYNDKEAVILIYSLHMKSKNENCKIDELLNIIEEEVEKNKNQENTETINCNIIENNSKINNLKQGKYNSPTINTTEAKNNKAIQNPVHIVDEEQIEKEIEILYYPLTSYIVVALSFIASSLLIYIIYRLGLLNQIFSLNIDRTKAGLLAMLFIIANMTAVYTQFNKGKKLSRMCIKNIYNTQKDDVQKDNIEKIQIKNIQKDEEYMKDVFTQKAEAVPLFEEDTVILKDNRDTCIISLIPEDKLNYQVITINEFPYYIGKLKYNTNSCILKPTISKIHAKISKEDAIYIIHDLNSTNGTFVNELRLPVNGSSQIVNNDKITFADVVFVFKCES